MGACGASTRLAPPRRPGAQGGPDRTNVQGPRSQSLVAAEGQGCRKEGGRRETQTLALLLPQGQRDHGPAQ